MRSTASARSIRVTGAGQRVMLNHVAIYPASHYVDAQGENGSGHCRKSSRSWKSGWHILKEKDKLIEAQRIEQRTCYDMEMLQEIGFCSGIENYSRVMSGRAPGSAPLRFAGLFPQRLLDVYRREPCDAAPGARPCTHGDRARKESLVDYGFRLPSAFDNRPLEL